MKIRIFLLSIGIGLLGSVKVFAQSEAFSVGENWAQFSKEGKAYPLRSSGEELFSYWPSAEKAIRINKHGKLTQGKVTVSEGAKGIQPLMRVVQKVEGRKNRYLVLEPTYFCYYYTDSLFKKLGPLQELNKVGKLITSQALQAYMHVGTSSLNYVSDTLIYFPIDVSNSYLEDAQKKIQKLPIGLVIRQKKGSIPAMLQERDIEVIYAEKSDSQTHLSNPKSLLHRSSFYFQSKIYYYFRGSQTISIFNLKSKQWTTLKLQAEESFAKTMAMFNELKGSYSRNLSMVAGKEEISIIHYPISSNIPIRVYKFSTNGMLLGLDEVPANALLTGSHAEGKPIFYLPDAELKAFKKVGV